MTTPVGEIIVVRVFGDVDLTTHHVLEAALTQARQRRPGHLVVDVTGMGFCSVRGLTLLVPARVEPAEYRLSGVGPHIDRVMGLLWPAGALPLRYPSARAAVLAAMVQQRDRHRRREPPAGDNDAYRDPTRRHRDRTYRSVVRMLGSTENPEDEVQDIAARLRSALAAGGEAGPP